MSLLGLTSSSSISPLALSPVGVGKQTRRRDVSLVVEPAL